MTIHRFPDLETLSWAAVAHFVAMAGVTDRMCVALSGGNSPRRFYELVSTREDIDWARIHLFWGDERYVSPDDPRSNERMVREALIQCIEIPVENLHYVYDPDGWEESALRYEKVLRRFFTGDTTFDLAIQGMGEDGHTASIFPGLPPPPPDRWVITTQGPPESPQRISLTLDCLAASREVMFIVDGASKAERLREVIAGGDLPAAQLAAKGKDVHWWVDEAAASLL